MSGVRTGTRLDQLLALRARLDHEIAAEQARQLAHHTHPSKPTPTRQPRPDTVTELLARHGLTAIQVKRWAHEHGLIPTIARGRVARALVDTYIQQNGTP